MASTNKEEYTMIERHKKSVTRISSEGKCAERSGKDQRPTRIYHPETRSAQCNVPTRIIRKHPIAGKV